MRTTTTNEGLSQSHPKRGRSRYRAVGRLLVLCVGVVGAASATPVVYEIDPDHTYPSFEADHMGVSVWRGKLNRTFGHVTVDRTAGTGSVELVFDLSSIDFGKSELNVWAQGTEFFNVSVYPTATYKGTLGGFVRGAPSRVTGQLSLHGVMRPVPLQIKSFKCIPHPVLKRELCGADAAATFRRDEFGLTAGRDYGFNMEVVLRIQVEAIAVP